MPGAWSGWGDGPSRGAMVLVMLQPVLLSWLLAGVRWSSARYLPAVSAGFGFTANGLRLTLALLGSLLTAILTLPCIAIAIGISAGRCGQRQHGFWAIGESEFAPRRDARPAHLDGLASPG